MLSAFFTLNTHLQVPLLERGNTKRFEFAKTEEILPQRKFVSGTRNDRPNVESPVCGAFLILLPYAHALYILASMLRALVAAPY